MKKPNRPNTGGTLLAGKGHAGVHQDRRRPCRKSAKQSWQKQFD